MAPDRPQPIYNVTTLSVKALESDTSIIHRRFNRVSVLRSGTCKKLNKANTVVAAHQRSFAHPRLRYRLSRHEVHDQCIHNATAIGTVNKLYVVVYNSDKAQDGIRLFPSHDLDFDSRRPRGWYRRFKEQIAVDET